MEKRRSSLVMFLFGYGPIGVIDLQMIFLMIFLNKFSRFLGFVDCVFGHRQERYSPSDSSRYETGTCPSAGAAVRQSSIVFVYLL